jgi:hypothetical protein
MHGRTFFYSLNSGARQYQPAFDIVSGYGCGTGSHSAEAYEDCSMCHNGECQPVKHMDLITEVSNMPLDWATCGLCHPREDNNHPDYEETCSKCHDKLEPHPCKTIPKIIPIDNMKTKVNRLLIIEIKLYDSSKTNLTYSAENLPSSASLDLKTGVFSWKPKNNQTGKYAVTFKVTDDGQPPLSDSETITITVQRDDSSEQVLPYSYAKYQDLILTNYYQQDFRDLNLEFINQPEYRSGQTRNLQNQYIYNNFGSPASISSFTNSFRIWERQQKQLSFVYKNAPFVNQYQTFSYQYQQNPFRNLLDNKNPLSVYYPDNFAFTNNFTLQLNNRFVYPVYHTYTQRLRINPFQSFKLE